MAPRFKRPTLEDLIVRGRIWTSAGIALVVLLATYGLVDKITGQ
jgi:hypothetical protein